MLSFSMKVQLACLSVSRYETLMISLNTYDGTNRVNIISNMYGEVRRRDAIVMKVVGFFTW